MDIEAETPVPAKGAYQEFRDASGTVIKVKVPAPGEGESVFAMAGHKAGSTMLQGIIRMLSFRARRPVLAIESQLFKRGYPIVKAPAELFELWKQPGYLFTGIRYFNPYFETAEFRRDARKILLVRDPRDVATSLYFSHASSHRVPDEGELSGTYEKVRRAAQSSGINEYITGGKVDSVLNSMTAFSGLLGSQRLNLFRYEDIIFNKRQWIQELGRVIGMKIPDQLMERVLQQHDILPDEEDAARHVRQVKPGNFQKHLSPAAIDYIQRKYRPLFELYRYELV